MTVSETKVPVESRAIGRDISAWFTAGRFAAILGLLLFATFADVITGQAAFFYRDFGSFTYPTAFFQHQSFWRGEVPLWNPLNNCGIPFLAQWNTSSLYPPSLFYLLLPLPWSLGVFCVGHLFFAGMGMYFLAQRWTGNRFAAAVAGLMFAYNGLSWDFLMWISNLVDYAWMPWVVVAVQCAWRKGGRSIILAGLAGAMQMLGGAPELILQTWFFLGLLWLLEFCEGDVRRLKMVVRPIGTGLLVAALSAAQLLPFLDLLAQSERNTSYNYVNWAMPLSGPANFLVPLFHCLPAGHGVFMQYEQYWISSYYVGIGTIALALLACWQVRDKRVWLLAGITVFSILMSMGTNGLIYKPLKVVLPQLSFIRYAIKFVVLAVFALPLLSAYAVNWSQSAIAKSRRALLPGPVIGAIIIASIGGIIWLAKTRPMAQDNLALTYQNAAIRGVLLAIFLAAVLLLQRATEFKKQLGLGLALLAFLWVDIYTHAPNLTPTVPPAVYQPGLIRSELSLNTKPEVGEPRAMPSAEVLDQVRYTSLANAHDDYLTRRLTLYDNCNLLDEIPKTDGFYSLSLQDSQSVAALLLQTDAKGWSTDGLKDFLQVKYVNPHQSPEAKKIGEWNTRKSALPFITAGQKPIFADGKDVLAGMFRAEFNPREQVFLPTAVRPHVMATNVSAAKVTVQQLSAVKLLFDVEASAPALVSVAQSFYHPWHAYVDGRSVALWKANFGFQALEVPAGKHSVRLEYEDRSFRRGSLISLVSLLGSGIACLCWGKRRRTPDLVT